MQRQLEGCPVPWAFFDAVDGNDVTTDLLDEHGAVLFPGWRDPGSPNAYHRRELKNGEIGCALSHHAVWKMAMDRDLDHLIVLEDDVLFPTGGLREALRLLDTLERKAPRWDLLYFFRNRRDPREVEESVCPGLTRAGFSYGAVAYALSRRGLRKVLSRGYLRAIVPVDEFLPALYSPHPREDVRAQFPPRPRLAAFAATPNVVQVDDSSSDTEASQLFGPAVRLGSRLKVSPSTRACWTDGRLILSVPISPMGVSVSAKSGGAALLHLVNAFAAPARVGRVVDAMVGEGHGRADVVATIHTLVNRGVLDVVD